MSAERRNARSFCRARLTIGQLHLIATDPPQAV